MQLKEQVECLKIALRNKENSKAQINVGDICGVSLLTLFSSKDKFLP
jgi:hypothetical protein